LAGSRPIVAPAARASSIAASTRRVLDAAVLGQPGPVPERQHHVAGLEEDDVVAGLGPGRPSQSFVEGPGPLQVGDAEGDDADPLLHITIVPVRMAE